MHSRSDCDLYDRELELLTALCSTVCSVCCSFTDIVRWIGQKPPCCPPANLHDAPERWPIDDLEAVLLQADDYSPRAACCAGDLTCAQQFRLRPTVNTYGTKPDFTPVAIYRVFSLPWSLHVFTKHQREITCKGANITQRHLMKRQMYHRHSFIPDGNSVPPPANRMHFLRRLEEILISVALIRAPSPIASPWQWPLETFANIYDNIIC